jgi:P4 family phage/plasmid primase-like protien
MEQTIENLLRQNYVEGIFHTHVSLIQPKGKYHLSRQSFEELWKVYSESIKEGKIMGIAEKPQYYLPVLGDVDIKIKLSDTSDGKVGPLYDDDKVSCIIEIYQSVLRKIVDECTDEMLICVLLEKPSYIVEKNGMRFKKNGFHLHFPGCFLSKVDQEIHLIPRVQSAIDDLKLFENVGYSSSAKVIDSNCCTVPWLLLGSRKGADMDTYTVSKVFNSEGDVISVDDAFQSYNVFDEQEQRIKIDKNVSVYMPRILSIIPYGRETQEVKHGLISPLKEKIKMQKNDKKVFKKVSVIDAIKKSKKLLPMLSLWRTQDRNEWMKIGWILYNISDGSPEALDLWCEFSAQDEDSYDEAVCIYQWDKMTRKDITLGTLRHYARLDSPEKYREFCTAEAEIHVEEALNGSHNDIAKILFAEYGDRFVCASITSKAWFQFNNHKWEQIEEGIFLRQKISGEVVKKFAKLGQQCFADLTACEDKAKTAMHNEKVNRVQKMIGNLKSAPYKSNIMKECMEVFYDRRFREKLDTNAYLIAFKNGVYDLKLNIFRSGIPEDFLSKSLPINCPTGMDEDNSSVQDVRRFLEQVFPDKSVRTYFLDTSSDIFVGGNHQKIVLVWTGDGDNAKSVTQTIFEKMMGEMAIKLNTTVVTGKKVASGSANADLARAGGGVRWAVLEEPGGDEMINDGILNNLSGNDSFYARDLFERGKDGREIQPMFKLIFICNKLPKLRYNLKATWNRIRVIPFESVFVRPNDPEPPPDTYEGQLREKRFPMDKNFSQKIPGMLEAFAWILLEHRKTLTVRIEPEKVRMATEMYRKQNDSYRKFCEENIMEDKKSEISLTEIYAQFKEWFRESRPNHTVPIKDEVEEYFTKLWDDPNRGKKWSGYRIRTMKDDIEDGTVVVLDEDDMVDYHEAKENLPDM